jgi:hypothetical protein
MQKLSLRFLSFTLSLFFVVNVSTVLIAQGKQQKAKQGICTRLRVKYNNLRKRYRKYCAHQCTPREEEQFENELYVLGNIVLATGIGCILLYTKGTSLYQYYFPPEKAALPTPPIPQPPINNPLPPDNPPSPMPKKATPEKILVPEQPIEEPAAPEGPLEQPLVQPALSSPTPAIELPVEKPVNPSLQQRIEPTPKDDKILDIDLKKFKQELNEFADKSKHTIDKAATTLKNKWLQFKNNIT